MQATMIKTEDCNLPHLIVAMGVSGSGKTTLAKALGKQCAYRFLDGDDYHSEEAKARMASGIPLSDEMRLPWVRQICGHLQQLACTNQSCVLAFSGLKKAHRDRIRKTGFKTTFVFLNGDKSTIHRRLEKRSDHFMPLKLLKSQFESLERPLPAVENDVVMLDIKQPPQQLLEKALSEIKEATGNNF